MTRLPFKPNWGRFPNVTAAALYHNRMRRRERFEAGNASFLDMDQDGKPDTMLAGTAGNGHPAVSIDEDSVNIDLDGDGISDIEIPR